MTPEEQVRKDRLALNAAINARDIDAIGSFLHPEFTATEPGGKSMSKGEMMKQIKKMADPGLEFNSELEVESIQVNEGKASVQVRRTESSSFSNSQVFNMFLFLAALMLFLGSVTAFRLEEWGTEDFVTVGVFTSACVFCVWIAFRLGRRKLRQEISTREGWQLVDGRWLLESEELTS